MSKLPGAQQHLSGPVCDERDYADIAKDVPWQQRLGAAPSSSQRLEAQQRIADHAARAR